MGDQTLLKQSFARNLSPGYFLREAMEKSLHLLLKFMLTFGRLTPLLDDVRRPFFATISRMIFRDTVPSGIGCDQSYLGRNVESGFGYAEKPPAKAVTEVVIFLLDVCNGVVEQVHFAPPSALFTCLATKSIMVGSDIMGGLISKVTPGNFFSVCSKMNGMSSRRCEPGTRKKA